MTTFQVINLKQGTPEWKAHRANHLNASDAPAALSCSPNMTRTELIRQLASGIERDFSDYVQERILDKGHVFEAYARPMAEGIVGEELFPVVGVNGKYSASYDGLTMLEDRGFEHKRLNAVLREAMHEGCTGADLPLCYQVQMEQQCMVCPTIERVLFMASEWDAQGNLIEERHCWYYPNLQLRSEIVTAWDLIEQDVAAYDPAAESAPEVVGQAPDLLPALRIDVQGAVTASNLESYKAVALRTIGSIKTTLVTDQDFADAEKTIKWCGNVESSLDAAKQHALSQTESIERLFRAIDDIHEKTRQVRLKLEKLVKSEKDARRQQIVTDAQQKLDEHINGLNDAMGANYIPRQSSVFAPVIKGLKSLDSMTDKVNGELARQITAADALFTRLKENRQHLRQQDGDWITLFPDFAAVGTKATEDFQALAALRITRHKQAEAERREKEREQIRREEAERADREAREKLAAEERAAQEDIAQAAQSGQIAAPVAADLGGLVAEKRVEAVAGLDAAQAIGAAQASTHTVVVQPLSGIFDDVDDDDGSTITLGQLNARLAPIKLDAAGLEALGFTTTRVKAAMHFPAFRFPALCDALTRHLHSVRNKDFNTTEATA